MDKDFDVEPTKKPLEELTRIRDCWDGDFYPLTEATHADDCWCAYQFALKEKGYCLFFRRENNQEATKTFQLNAIDATKSYEVTLSDENYDITSLVLKGEELINYTANIPEPLSSLMLSYKEI